MNRVEYSENEIILDENKSREMRVSQLMRKESYLMRKNNNVTRDRTKRDA
jgi:hypothetical protein